MYLREKMRRGQRVSALPAGPAVLPGELGAVAAGGTGTLLLDAGPAAPQEAPRLGALDAVQRPAQHSRVIHLAVGLAAELRRGQRSAGPGGHRHRGRPRPALTFTQPWPSSCCAVAFPPWSTGSSHSTNSSGLRGRSGW